MKDLIGIYQSREIWSSISTKPPVYEFDIFIANIRLEKPGVVGLIERMIESHASIKIILITGPKPRGLCSCSILAEKTQHLNFHSNLLVSILIADVADDREAERQTVPSLKATS